MSSPSARLYTRLKAAGIAVVGVSHGNNTFTVQPSSLQSACQSIIDAFDPNDTRAEREASALRQRDLDMPIIRTLLDVLPTLIASIDAGTYDAGEAENRIFQTIRKYRRGLKQE